ncbi:MAG: thermopsin family protease [Thermoplasmata archaeon]|nr:thermopsin family protease [Thermoplasmata archaeon]
MGPVRHRRSVARPPGPAWLLSILLLTSLAGAIAVVAPAHAAAPSRGAAAAIPVVHPFGLRGPVPISPPHPVHRSVVPLGNGVDPFAFFQSEPASLGVTDYGVNAQGNGYSYSTPIWWADANITRILAYYPSDVSGDGFITFQLNVVLKLTSPGGTTYAFWIQDVVDVDTVGRAIGFLDNVWNLSTGGTLQPTGSIVGNGSVGSFGPGYFYGDSPPCQGSTGGYAGNCVSIKYPYLVTERVTSGEVGGTPHVSFQYDSGAGWVTYDNVSFPFAHGFTDHDFTVDGTQYTPLGLFYDGEWDYTGPPGGTQDDRNTQMDMQLDLWNGHNLQAVPDAFNFGSNTGESISNVIAGPYLNATNGTVGAQVTSGGGKLGALYYSTNVSTLYVAAPELASGTIVIGGEPHPYVGNQSEFTLTPGGYNVSLWAGSSLVGYAQVTLIAGQATHIALGYPTPYPVDFLERGLPAGIGWSLTVGGIAYPNPGSAMELELTNGTYVYSVTPVVGFTTPTYASQFTVAGGNVVIYVNFTAYLFSVTFSEAGLPAGATWGVDLAGTTVDGIGVTIVFHEANGTYPYTTGAGAEYTASPSASTAVVTGTPDFELISFGLSPGYLTGKVTPANAAVFVGGSAEPTADGTFNLSLLPGLYTVEVTATGYNASWYNVTVSPGHATALAVALNASPLAKGGGGGSPPTTSTGSISTTTALLIVAVVAVAAVGVVGTALLMARARRR